MPIYCVVESETSPEAGPGFCLSGPCSDGSPLDSFDGQEHRARAPALGSSPGGCKLVAPDCQGFATDFSLKALRSRPFGSGWTDGKRLCS